MQMSTSTKTQPLNPSLSLGWSQTHPQLDAGISSTHPPGACCWGAGGEVTRDYSCIYSSSLRCPGKRKALLLVEILLQNLHLALLVDGEEELAAGHPASHETHVAAVVGPRQPCSQAPRRWHRTPCLAMPSPACCTLPRTSTRQHPNQRGGPTGGGETEAGLTEKSCRMAARPAPGRSRAGIWCTARVWRRSTRTSRWHPQIFPQLCAAARATAPVAHAHGCKHRMGPRITQLKPSQNKAGK